MAEKFPCHRSGERGGVERGCAAWVGVVGGEHGGLVSGAGVGAVAAGQARDVERGRVGGGLYYVEGFTHVGLLGVDAGQKPDERAALCCKEECHGGDCIGRHGGSAGSLPRNCGRA